MISLPEHRSLSQEIAADLVDRFHSLYRCVRYADYVRLFNISVVELEKKFSLNPRCSLISDNCRSSISTIAIIARTYVIRETLSFGGDRVQKEDTRHVFGYSWQMRTVIIRIRCRMTASDLREITRSAKTDVTTHGQR